MDDRLVDKETVRRFTVLAETFTVIADDHHNRPIEHPALVEKRYDPRELEVDEADGAALWILAVRRGEFLGRFSRGVRVVEVEPRKEAAATHLLQPAERVIHDAVGGAASDWRSMGPGRMSGSR